MKVKANNLFYGMLPSKKDKKKLMAADGMAMGNPVDPRIKNMVKTLPDNYFDIFGGQPQRAQTPGLAPIDKGTPNVQLPNQQQQIDPNSYNPGIKAQPPRRNPNVGNAIMLGLAAVDAAIPGERIHNQQVIHPQQGYAPHPLGTGSQALMADGGEVGPGPHMLELPPDTIKPLKIGDRTVDPGVIRNIVGESRKQHVDPYDALAIAYQESGIDRDNPYHLNPDYYGKSMGGPKSGVESIVKQMQYAKSLQKRGVIPDTDVYRLQGYNGYGKIGKGHADLEGAGSIYGQPIPEGGIDLKKNPLYGKRVTDIRDNMLKKNDSLRKYIETGKFDDGGWMMNPARDTPLVIPEGVGDNMPSAKSGNWIKGAVNPKHKGYCTPMTKSTCTPRRKAFAMTIKKHHGFHEAGGIIPDNMSAFSPHNYENGGSVNFLENIMFHPNMRDMQGFEDGGFLEHIMYHPNAADMAGYEYGGNIRGGSDTMNIFEQIVQHPNMQDMTGWDKAKSGKSLSPGKAREMLHDKSAHGHALTDKQRKYFGAVASGYAASGIGIGPGDPETKKPKSSQEQYYESSAQLAYYKNKLNDRLKSKNPQGFGDYFKGLSDLRRTGKTQDAQDYVQKSAYNDYLSPNEVKSTLGDSDYQKYLDSLKNVNTYDVQQGQQPLYGGVEGQNDLTKLNYGRRFASLQLTPHVGIHQGDVGSGKDYSRDYNYDPNKGVSFKESGDVSIRPDYLSPSMKNGGIMYADGGEVDTMWGGDVQQISDNPHDGGTMQFNGKSHENGGIGMHYNGNPVEVEGGETASRDSQGNLNIYGNMYLPGTRTKFKSVAKEIGQKEKRYDYLKTRGSELVNNSNPANKFERLAFNAGKVMMSGGSVGQKDLAEKKDKLASLQRAMLDTAAEHGIDAQHMSAGKIKKAKGGASIPFAADGYSTGPGDPNDPKRSDRNNNPGNIRYGKWAKENGAVGQDADGFAIFKDRQTGSRAMQGLLTSGKYKDLSVNKAIKKWTGGKPYQYDLGEIDKKKVSDLSPEEFDQVMGTMTKGEGTRYGYTPGKPKSPGKPTPKYGIPDIPLTPDATKPTPKGATPPDLGTVTPPGRRRLPSNVEPLHLDEVAGEIYGAASNKVEPVAMQQYNPQLYQPYQVSFQDRINQNQSTYNALQRTLGSTNPAALNQIAAQKYAADSGVKGEEFRTNQAISDDITNKNIALRNDAQMKNLGLADQQYVRQSTAKSKTKQLNQMIINSLSSKYAQNELENKRLAAYENLYDYRFTPGELGGLDATYFGPNAAFNFNNNRAPGQGNADIKTVSKFDQYGNPKGYTQYDDSRLKEQKDALELEMRRRKLPMLSAPPLN